MGLVTGTGSDMAGRQLMALVRPGPNKRTLPWTEPSRPEAGETAASSGLEEVVGRPREAAAPQFPGRCHRVRGPAWLLEEGGELRSHGGAAAVLSLSRLESFNFQQNSLLYFFYKCLNYLSDPLACSINTVVFHLAINEVLLFLNLSKQEEKLG